MDRRRTQWIRAVGINRRDGRAPLDRGRRERWPERMMVEWYGGGHVSALGRDGVRVIDMGRWLLEPRS